ncbi:MAG: NADH-quinone oxidoreductase subunit NuoK [Actinomycetales bacterium]
MSLVWPSVLAALLAGVGVFGILVRRNAIMVLVGAELLVNAAVLVLIVGDARAAATGLGGGLLSGQVGALFAITVAAAEVGLALAVVLLLFRTRSSIDLTETATVADPGSADADQRSPSVPAADRIGTRRR